MLGFLLAFFYCIKKHRSIVNLSKKSTQKAYTITLIYKFTKYIQLDLEMIQY